MGYTAYELSIQSEFVLPELDRCDDCREPDVHVSLGTVDTASIPEEFRQGPVTWISKDFVCFEVPGVARFRIDDGRHIVIDPLPGGDECSIRTFLLGSAFGALLCQQGFLVLHGNAIRIGDECLVCVGCAGAGKSTLAAGFMRRGFQVLADDVVPVNAEAEALPGFPRIKLWQDVADKLDIDTSTLARIRPGIEKFSFPIQTRLGRQRLPVRWIYVLGIDNRLEDTSIESVAGMDRFIELRNHTYRSLYVQRMGRKREHLRMCEKLVERAYLARVWRPRDRFVVDRLVDRLLEDVAENP